MFEGSSVIYRSKKTGKTTAIVWKASENINHDKKFEKAEYEALKSGDTLEKLAYGTFSYDPQSRRIFKNEYVFCVINGEGILSPDADKFFNKHCKEAVEIALRSTFKPNYNNVSLPGSWGKALASISH
ncbi:MAG: hypothetical protein LBU87_05180 [Lactobacillales bacterium]|nr:hypothetical protein [Lactobacillales bacterium]